MALIKPIMLSVTAFDATKEYTFSFTSSGGDQVVANQLTIKNQETNKIVYQYKVTSYSFQQTVQPDTLVNGQYYTAYFNTYNVNGDESESSNVIQFNCYTTPSFGFINLPKNNLIENSNYTFSATYNQEQREMLNTMVFELYDSTDVLIEQSDVYYGTQTMPITISHTFSGFINDNTYSVKAKAVSVDGMVVETDLYTFTVRYQYPSMFNLLDLVNMCEKGCIKIESNAEMIEAETPPEFTPALFLSSLQVTDPSIYVQWDIPYEYDMENYQPISEWTELRLLDIHNYHNWVQWTKGFSIPSSFTFTAFMKVGRLGTFAILGTEQNGFTIELVREIPYGETEVKDRFEVKGYVDGELVVRQTSNYVDILNQSTYYMIWFRKVNDIYDLRMTILQAGVHDKMDWNDSTVWYERLTDISWNPEPYPQGDDFVSLANDISSIFPLGRVRLLNGIYDNMDITADVTKQFTTTIPSWDYSTKIACNFNNNLDGGNLDMLLSQIKYIKVKRRKKGTFNWVTLKQYEIKKQSDLNIIFEDYFAPTDYEAEYALVPVQEGGVEGTYIINDITTKFANTMIADQNHVFNLKADIQYGTDSKNTTFSTYEPLKGKYYIVQKNGNLDCWSGSVSAMVTGYNFNKTHKIDRQDVVKMTEDICEFFNTNTAKIIKDWNGKIHLVRFLGNPQVTYNNSYGNGVAYVSANWIEQGEFDNQSDLYNNGLVDVLS